LNKINALSNTLSAKKSKPEIEPKEEDKQKAKEAADRILKRAQDYLVRIAERKAAEQQKELDQKEKEKKLRQAAREAVLKNAKLSNLPREESSDSEAEEEEEQPVKKTRKPDDKVLKRLTQHIKKVSGPVITDWGQFRKRYKLDPSTKVFIINGQYQDVKKALKRRGK
jgi:lipopolysaccharide biosynthesis regulator YciM